MEKHSEIFVGLDVTKVRHAVAVAEDGRAGEVRYIGEIGSDAESVRRFVGKLEKRHSLCAASALCPTGRQLADGRGRSPTDVFRTWVGHREAACGGDFRGGLYISDSIEFSGCGGRI